MKLILKLYLISYIIQAIFINSAYAITIKDRVEYLVDVRNDDGDLIRTRLSLNKKLDFTNIETYLFGEGQWNTYLDEWEKVLFGAGIEKSFKKFLYIGQSIQVISGQMLDYMAFNTNSYSFDTTTKIGVYFSFLNKFSFNLFEEFSLNLEHGRGEYCESGSEISYNPNHRYSFGIGWHHTDRIHALDTDYASGFFTLEF